MECKAIIDLGSNTFNLLVAQLDQGKASILYSEERPVRLGKGSFVEGARHLQPDAMDRAWNALVDFKAILEKYQVDKVIALGTSALRDATNGAYFAEQAFQKTGINIQIIDGNREAELIFWGVRESGCLTAYPAVIVDIGGGSVEFIFVNAKGVLWQHSFNLGAVRILEQFSISDPLKPSEKQVLEDYLCQQLSTVKTQAEKYHPSLLVGSSGSFESLRDILNPQEQNNHTIPYTPIPLDDFTRIASLILTSTIDYRKNIPGLVDFRVETIVPATILTQAIMTITGVTSFAQCDYALKEGVLYNL